MVKSNIQSSNITNLCSELGFEKKYSDRDTKILTKAIADFRTSFINKGHHLPYSAPDSPEAQLFALEFCQENNRGEALWPTTSNSPWPSWSSDRSKCVASISIYPLELIFIES
jgi:hypothetical protein